MSLAPDPVELEYSAEGAAFVTLSRPSRRNALDELTIAQLAEASPPLRRKTMCGL